jgi:hypothetical protein
MRRGGSLVVPLLLAAALVSCSREPEQRRNERIVDSIKPAGAEGQKSGAASELRFTPPDGWISERPTSAMRKGQYRLPRAEGDAEDAELVVFYFEGQGGSVQANIDRWIGQFEKPAGGSAAEGAKVTKRQSHGIPVTLVDCSGTYTGGGGPMSAGPAKPNYRMLAAVAETPSGPWFFKLTGPARTVARWESSFSRFLDTIQ